MQWFNHNQKSYEIIWNMWMCVVEPKKNPNKQTKTQLLAPTTLFKPKNQMPYANDKNNDFANKGQIASKQQLTITTHSLVPPHKAAEDYSWDVVDEYDPLWPNEYEKLVKDRRERRENERKRRRSEQTTAAGKQSGFSGRPADDAESHNKSPPTLAASRAGGAAIAPPPSLQESIPIIPPQNLSNSSAYGGGSIAAKIMAKYGFKDGQGLGKKEQGMSMALQVEKTSKRGGRIIHEKEAVGPSSSPPPSTPTVTVMPPPAPVSMPPPPITPVSKEEQTITQILKSPSKVVLLRVSIWDAIVRIS